MCKCETCVPCQCKDVGPKTYTETERNIHLQMIADLKQQLKDEVERVQFEGLQDVEDQVQNIKDEIIDALNDYDENWDDNHKLERILRY